MCAIGMAIQLTTTRPIVAAVRYEDSNFRGINHGRALQQPLSRRWAVVTDEHGEQRLRMRWIIAPFVSETRS